MEKKTLSSILEGKIFQISDDQRGYAWEEKQWRDFVHDIDNLVYDKIISHYTGTIVIYQPSTRPTEDYGQRKLETVDVVDGVQRLITCSLYLSIIIEELLKIGKDAFHAEIPFYLYFGSKTKLRPNNGTADFYFDLISNGTGNIKANSVQEKRIYNAYFFLKKHIEEQLELRAGKGEIYLRDLFDAIIHKLTFSIYTIEVESEIGRTIALINSRGMYHSLKDQH
jgi:uncharacterized protein with ParB-like and HNH nuclease domain